MKIEETFWVKHGVNLAAYFRQKNDIGFQNLLVYYISNKLQIFTSKLFIKPVKHLKGNLI